MVKVKGKAFDLGYKVDDVVRVKGYRGEFIVDPDGCGYEIGGDDFVTFTLEPKKYELVHRNEVEVNKETDKPSGGPSKYYDFPFHDWATVNDMVEYLAKASWHHDSWIFKDIVKACTRWGMKLGTTKDYDARKIIYYGLRLLMSVSGKKAVQEYLTELSNDNQFK